MICPFCGEKIKDGAKKCRYCGEFLNENVEKNPTKNGNSTKEKKKLGKGGKIFWQFIIFLILVSISISLCDVSRFFVLITAVICAWYALCSRKDEKLIDFKACCKPERYKKIARLIVGGIMILLFGGLGISIYSDKKHEEKRVAAYNSAPTPQITILSEVGNIGDNTTYTLKAEIKDATEVTVNGDNVEIKNGNISKQLNLETPKLEIHISAKNEHKSSSHTINIERNMTEQEAEQARIEEEKRIAEEKAAQEEAERLEAEQKAIYAEKQARIDKLKSQCRITYDEFKKITWLEPNVFKNSNNQNAIEIYIGKYDDGTIIRRFKIMYAASNWLFIKNYQFSIGGDVITYYPDKVERDNYTTIWERSDNAYDTKADNIIKKLIENNGGTIRVNGSQYYDDRVISQKEINALKNMNELYELLQEKVRLGY